MKFIKSPYFILLTLLIIGFGSVLIFWYFNPTARELRQYKKGMEILTKKIQEEEAKYAADDYGGATPEETYQMFLEALKKQDIDLASKYFILSKQEEYKGLLNQIKNSGQWDEMMNDLLNPKNQKGKYEGDDNYIIEIVNDQNISVATVVLKILKSFIGLEKKAISNIWKITSF